MGMSLVLTLLAPNPVQTEVQHPIPAALRRKQKGKLCTQRLRASSTLGRSPGWGAGRELQAPGISHLLPLPTGLPRNGMRLRGASPAGTSPEPLQQATKPGPAHFPVGARRWGPSLH